MDISIPEKLIALVGIAVICSVFTIALVQKIKSFPFIINELLIWVVNAVVSFAVSIPLSMYFFDQDLISSFWVALFAFIGAPALYDALKNINLKSRTELQKK